MGEIKINMHFGKDSFKRKPNQKFMTTSDTDVSTPMAIQQRYSIYNKIIQA